MQTVSDGLRSTDLPRGCVATIGNFDGVHRGQRSLLERVVSRAGELGQAAVAVTFQPHPLRVIAPELEPPAITTPRQKEALLAAAGIDLLVRGIYRGGGDDGSTLYFSWDYFNEGMKGVFGPNVDFTGFYSIRVSSAELIPKMSTAIDEQFRNTSSPTKTESEKSFVLGSD